jgi:hypothetical protein
MPDTISPQEAVLLKAEIEMLIKERQSLLRIAGSAAGLIAELHSRDLPPSAVEAADILSALINALPEETLQDALQAVRAEILEG